MSGCAINRRCISLKPINIHDGKLHYVDLVRISSIYTLVQRPPYAGTEHKLVLAFDVGITYLGIKELKLIPPLSKTPTEQDARIMIFLISFCDFDSSKLINLTDISKQEESGLFVPLEAPKILLLHFGSRLNRLTQHIRHDDQLRQLPCPLINAELI
jgi:hypothetical protein